MHALRERLAALARIAPAPWTIDTSPDGMRYIRTARIDGENRLFVAHDLDPAPDADIEFIVAARNALERLAAVLDGDDPAIGEDDLERLESLAAGATTGPWRAWVEERGPIGGSSMIWIGDGDFGPDLYLWLGEAVPPPELFDFVAHAREDVPRLVAEIRRRREHE